MAKEIEENEILPDDFLFDIRQEVQNKLNNIKLGRIGI